MMKLAKFSCIFIALAFLAAAQDIPGTSDVPDAKAPKVSMVPPPVATVTRGKANPVPLRFRVQPGFHINSNTPTFPYLKPTLLMVDAQTDIVVGKVTYPTGEMMSFAFAPDEKLSVYAGVFDVSVSIRPLASVLPAKYAFRGRLKYQACDNAQCYPPKELPVQFEVKVVKAPVTKHRGGSPQSPHIHN